ncbi:MAG: hypothetical protein AB7Q45_17645 [Planctomycetaceae bacterium]
MKAIDKSGVHPEPVCGNAAQSPRPDRIPALTVLQPYAQLICVGAKQIENRTWKIAAKHMHRPLLLHAGMGIQYLEAPGLASSYVRGAIVAVVTIAAVAHKEWPEALWSGFGHLSLSEHAHGPWCHILTDVVALSRPVYVKGKQRIWYPEAKIIEAVRRRVPEGTL